MFACLKCTSISVTYGSFEPVVVAQTLQALAGTGCIQKHPESKNVETKNEFQRLSTLHYGCFFKSLVYRPFRHVRGSQLTTVCFWAFQLSTTLVYTCHLLHIKITRRRASNPFHTSGIRAKTGSTRQSGLLPPQHRWLNVLLNLISTSWENILDLITQAD